MCFDMALTISKQTENLLISFEEKTKNNDVKLELAKYKNTYMIFFFVAYDNKLKVHHKLTPLQIRKRPQTSTVSLLDEEQKCNAKTQKEYEASLEQDNKDVSEKK